MPVATVRIVAPEAGGGADLVARVVAERLSKNLNQQVLVDNRPGLAGMLANEVPQRT